MFFFYQHKELKMVYFESKEIRYSLFFSSDNARKRKLKNAIQIVIKNKKKLNERLSAL
jgi:hypothetical protein